MLLNNARNNAIGRDLQIRPMLRGKADRRESFEVQWIGLLVEV